MHTCTRCFFAVELDDVAIALGRGRCVCLHCHLREAGADAPLTSALRRAIVNALAASARVWVW